jgi:hypothetical protein
MRLELIKSFRFVPMSRSTIRTLFGFFFLAREPVGLALIAVALFNGCCFHVINLTLFCAIVKRFLGSLITRPKRLQFRPDALVAPFNLLGLPLCINLLKTSFTKPFAFLRGTGR